MKSYGQKRTESPGRIMRGTSRPCPCCMRVNPNCKKTKRAIKKRERQAGRQIVAEQS